MFSILSELEYICTAASMTLEYLTLFSPDVDLIRVTQRKHFFYVNLC